MNHSPKRYARRMGAVVLAAVIGTSALAAQTADAKQQQQDGPRLARQLTRDVTPNGVFRHLRAFQRIAEQNGNTRAAGTPGYAASVDYVAGLFTGAEVPKTEEQAAKWGGEAGPVRSLLPRRVRQPRKREP